jgi:hypothetical protein
MGMCNVVAGLIRKTMSRALVPDCELGPDTEFVFEVGGRRSAEMVDRQLRGQARPRTLALPNLRWGIRNVAPNV